MLDIIQHTQKINLLYVEDNEDARESTLNLFENFFTNITIAVDGQDGLDKFKNNKFDLIITDIDMPLLSGLKMIEEIKQLDKNIPILVLSAYNEISYTKKSTYLDIYDYLVKPIELDQFIICLNRLFNT